MTGGAFQRHRVGVETGGPADDTFVASSTDLFLGGRQKRLMVRGMGVMAVETVPGSRRRMDGSVGRLLRHVMAVEADGGAIRRSRALAVFMAGSAIQFRVDRSFQQSCGTAGMGRVAGSAVGPLHCNPVVGLPKPDGLAVVTVTAELLLVAFQEERVVAAVANVAGTAVAGRRRMDQFLLEPVPVMAITA